MTPHKHWVRNYEPFVVPVRLADNTIIYSAGVGTVVFNPVIRGKPARSVEFTRVLHVPQLRNNLLSCLYLTKQKGFKIIIDNPYMDFYWKQDKKILFSATISDKITAHLDGVTEEAISESANVSSTLPLNLNLWHRRLAHHSYDTVKKMIREKLVTGLVILSDEKADPICEPCLAGKMHSNPFPSSDSHAMQPL